MFDLQIGIPCGPNSELFANFLLASLRRTITNSKKVEVIIGINKPNTQKDLIIANIKNLNVRFVERHTSHKSSAGHADCLNLIIENMTSRWGIFLDADVAVLKKEWEIDLLNQLNNHVVMIGSEYHKHDGKMIRRPNVITCAFDVDVFKKLNIDFMPSMKSILINENNQHIFGADTGSSIFMDTGCDMIESLITRGYETKVLDIASPRYSETHKDLKVLDLNQRGEEYHLNGVAISTHLGRSLTRNFNNDPIVSNWTKKVEEWLNGQV